MTKGSHDNEQPEKLHHPADDVTNKLLRFAIKQRMLKTGERSSFLRGQVALCLWLLRLHEKKLGQ